MQWLLGNVLRGFEPGYRRERAMSLGPLDDRDFYRGISEIIINIGVPTGIRTPVTAVKGRCPRPLDDRDVSEVGVY